MAGAVTYTFSFSEKDLGRYPSGVSDLRDILDRTNLKIDTMRKNIAAGVNKVQNLQLLQIALKGHAACSEKLKRVLSEEQVEAEEYGVDYSEIIETRKQSNVKNRILGICKRRDIVRNTPLPANIPHLNDGQASTLICLSYIIMCNRALHERNDELSCLIYVGQIAKELDASKRTIRRHLSALENMGLILREAVYRPSLVRKGVENDGNILSVAKETMDHFKRVKHIKKRVADFLKGYGHESPTYKDPNKFESNSTMQTSLEIENVGQEEECSQEALNEKNVAPSRFELSSEALDQIGRKSLSMCGIDLHSSDFDAVRQATNKLRKQHFAKLDDATWRKYRGKHGRMADLALIWAVKAPEIRKRANAETPLERIRNPLGYLVSMLRKPPSELRPDVSLGLLLKAAKESIPHSVRLRIIEWETENKGDV